MIKLRKHIDKTHAFSGGVREKKNARLRGNYILTGFISVFNLINECASTKMRKSSTKVTSLDAWLHFSRR